MHMRVILTDNQVSVFGLRLIFPLETLETSTKIGFDVCPISYWVDWDNKEISYLTAVTVMHAPRTFILFLYKSSV